MSNRSTHGGTRPGSGRKPKSGPTKRLTLRPPLSDLALLAKAGISNLNRFYVQAGHEAIKRLSVQKEGKIKRPK